MPDKSKKKKKDVFDTSSENENIDMEEEKFD